MGDVAVPGEGESRSPVPPMPLIGPGEGNGGTPHPLLDGVSPTIGWQRPPTDGPAFVIIARTALGSLKVAERFPLTEDGWAQAWQSLVQRDPGAAGKVRAVLLPRAAEDQQPPQAPQVPGPPPNTVVIAVRLMHAGAAGLPLAVLGDILAGGLVGPAKGSPGSDLGATILNSALLVLLALPVTALWLWMAMMNKRGRSWARIVSTALFGLYSVSLIPLPALFFLSLSGTPAPTSSQVLYLLLGFAGPILLGWAVGLVVIVLLWRRPSREYYTSAGRYASWKAQSPAT